MSYEDLRKEFESVAFRDQMKKVHPPVCNNCGSKGSVEYHHVVPLKLGGTNNLLNIVPLCHKCHKAAHNGRHMSHYADTTNAGRKSTASIEKDSKVFDMFIGGEIGNLKCCELLGYSPKSRIRERAVFKEYIKSKGIARVRNIIDVSATNRPGLNYGDVVGEIEYTDGRIEPMIFKDTGINDVEYGIRGEVPRKETTKKTPDERRATDIAKWKAHRSQLRSRLAQSI